MQFNYDNGVGSRVDRFKIDLYLSEGTGDCGTWVTNLCDKESIGCKDSSELFVLERIFLYTVPGCTRFWYDVMVHDDCIVHAF